MGSFWKFTWECCFKDNFLEVKFFSKNSYLCPLLWLRWHDLVSTKVLLHPSGVDKQVEENVKEIVRTMGDLDGKHPLS